MGWISITPQDVTYMLFIDNHDMPSEPAALHEFIEQRLRAAGVRVDVNRKTGELAVAHGRMAVEHGADKTAYLWIVPASALRSQPLPKLHDFITRDPYPDLPHFPSLMIPRAPQQYGGPTIAKHWRNRK